MRFPFIANAFSMYCVIQSTHYSIRDMLVSHSCYCMFIKPKAKGGGHHTVVCMWSSSPSNNRHILSIVHSHACQAYLDRKTGQF